MMVLVAYDVSTTEKAGQRRLRRVAKYCMRYGQRVQNSVFECVLSPAELVELKGLLLKVVDAKKDSLRFYYLGDKYQSKIEAYGTAPVLLSDEVMIV